MWRCQRQKNGSRMAVAGSPMSPGSPPPFGAMTKAVMTWP